MSLQKIIPYRKMSIKELLTPQNKFMDFITIALMGLFGLGALNYLIHGHHAYAVTRDQYPILLHPVSFKDFILGGIIAEAFAIAKFNVIGLWIFYSLTSIAIFYPRLGRILQLSLELRTGPG